MKPSLHAISSLGLGALIGHQLQSLPALIATTAAGVLVDLDHIIDYVYYWYKQSCNAFKQRSSLKQTLRELFSIANFFNAFYFGKIEKIFILFHSFEWSLLLGIAYLFTGNIILLSCFAGHLLHLVCDTVFNKPRLFGYFLIYRIIHRFEREQICAKDGYLKKTFLGKYIYQHKSDCSNSKQES